MYGNLQVLQVVKAIIFVVVVIIQQQTNVKLDTACCIQMDQRLHTLVSDLYLNKTQTNIRIKGEPKVRLLLYKESIPYIIYGIIQKRHRKYQ